MALGSTQPLTEMSTGNIFCEVKAARAWAWQPYRLHVPTIMKSGNLNLLEPSGPVQACNGIALPLDIHFSISFRCIRFEYFFSIDPYVKVFTKRVVLWVYFDSSQI